MPIPEAPLSTLDFAPPRGTALRPLFGLRLLLVEDSRFAADAVRLMSQKSGARLRRADCLAAAHRHLAAYRPDIVIVDMGLPDGSGAELIGELATAEPQIPAILGLSGDPWFEDLAIAAGAQGFLTKPLESIAVFQSEILEALPRQMQPVGPRLLPQADICPDPLALHEDLSHAENLLADGDDPGLFAYLVQFLGGIATSLDDTELGAAALALSRREEGAVDRLRAVIRDRQDRVVAMA